MGIIDAVKELTDEAIALGTFGTFLYMAYQQIPIPEVLVAIVVLVAKYYWDKRTQQ